MADKQEASCTAATQQAASLVATGASSAQEAIAAARGVCKSLQEDELNALEKAFIQQARSALLAAGFKSEQFSRADMLPLCKAKDRMPVEMVAHQVQGQPRYWDCADHIVYQDVPQTSAACKARGLDYTTVRDEHGQDLGACKIGEELLAATQLRQACKLGPNAKIQPADEAEVKAMCRMAVERGLKAPKSAEHPGVFDQDGKPTKAKDGCTTVYVSYVDAPNPMGVKLRTRYRCVYDPRTGVASVETE